MYFFNQCYINKVNNFHQNYREKFNSIANETFRAKENNTTIKENSIIEVEKVHISKQGLFQIVRFLRINEIQGKMIQDEDDYLEEFMIILIFALDMKTLLRF